MPSSRYYTQKNFLLLSSHTHFLFHRLRARWRQVALLVVAFVAFFVYFVGPQGIYINPQALVKFDGKRWGRHPTYTKIYEAEQNLPQHNLDLPFPEGRTGRYVRFSSQIQELGWNNVLNELLMNCHLAYRSQRAYVFQNYVWKEEYFPWRIPLVSFHRHIRKPRTPLSALIGGPTVGGPWEKGDPAPRSISEDWFDVVCPWKERRIIYTRELKPQLSDKEGTEVFARWMELLRDAPERCVEVKSVPRKEDGFPQVFDLYLWGHTRILSLWPEFSKSPTSRLLRTSDLVEAAVSKNDHLFTTNTPRLTTGTVFDHVLAAHVRRGDFKDACLSLARWNSTYYSWNQLPGMPDTFTPPPGGSWGENTPENVEKYMVHCLPSSEAITQRIRDARNDYARLNTAGGDRALDVMFLLTNEEGPWLDILKEELTRDGWLKIVTSKDLVLDDDEIGVSMAIDMDIARRAAVLIGNGWSSFTSNIVHRRLVDGKDIRTNRFW